MIIIIMMIVVRKEKIMYAVCWSTRCVKIHSNESASIHPAFSRYATTFSDILYFY